MLGHFFSILLSRAFQRAERRTFQVNTLLDDAQAGNSRKGKKQW